MRERIVLAVTLAVLVGWTAGCKKETIDKAEFKSAINNYYSGRQECIWTAPIKFPAQADTSNEDQTKGYDALTDAGMLTRTPAEKKRFLIGSKQVNDYDLSEKGRSAWKPDQAEPGYGNFCFGHFAVQSIDSFTPNDEANPTQYTVNYHYTAEDVPDWAATAEMKTAFSKIASDTSGTQTATAALQKAGNGWQVSSVQPETPVR